jgi:hypothetical protein
MVSRFHRALIIAGISDLLDFMGIGEIPILGEVIDIITAALLYPYIGRYVFIGLVPELAPLYLPVVGMLIDELPSWLLAVFIARSQGVFHE